MKYIIATLLIIASIPAFASEEYNAGYNAGYYGGMQPQYEGGQYGRGYEDGLYDSDQDDAQARQRSEAFEAAQVREQERDEKAITGSGDGNNSGMRGNDINGGGQASVYGKISNTPTDAADPFLQQAESGDSNAQYKLGLKYWTDATVDEMMKENGIPPTNPVGRHNYFDAVGWFRKAAEHGNEKAQDSLGEAYRDGKGTTQDYAVALKWFNKAVHAGMGSAEYDLGMLFENGWGVPKNYVTAQMWYILAALPPADQETVDRTIVAKNRDRLATKMTPEQIAEAQKLAREWKPK
jgi:TPR repeat protein